MRPQSIAIGLGAVRSGEEVELRLEDCEEDDADRYGDIDYSATIHLEPATLTADSLHGRVDGPDFLFDVLALTP